MSEFNFKVVIDDGYCAHEYMFEMPDDVSIEKIAKAISAKFKVIEPKSKLVREGKDKKMFKKLR